MPNETKTLFESLGGTFQIPAGGGSRGDATYRFEVDGGDVWQLRFQGSNVRVVRGAEGEADCTFHADDHDMALVLSGRQNLLTAVMQGRVLMDGDWAMGQRFHAFLQGTGLNVPRRAA